LLNCGHFLHATALPLAQRTLTWPCSCSRLFSVFLVTGLPQNSGPW
jgi:hypothetical protein